MAPRRPGIAEWLRSSARLGGAISRQPLRSRRCNSHYCVALSLWLLLGAFAAFTGAAEAVPDASPSSHFNGLHVLSGSSFRAFSNRFRRQLRRAPSECLSFHEAGNWWRYEWCVGRRVRQFHDLDHGHGHHHDGDHHNHSLVLGRFSAAASRQLRVLPLDDPDALRNPDLRGYYAAQLYTHGDVCEPAGSNATTRQVEIQYKCCVLRANESYIESVDEPAPCVYTLAVCTPAACGIMQKDQYVFGVGPHVGEAERLGLVATVKDMFYHAYHGYMDHAFPLDALLPLSCRGETFELGKIPMLTLIDTLDTLAILEDAVEFQRAVKLVVSRSTFDLDTAVSVFETTIRVLGGLLSAHLFAVEPSLALFPPGVYQDELLALAVDLGDRLMPAFNTTTGIPYGTVNLRHGVPKGETPIASTAGAGSLSMEFTMLSVLTGNTSYASAARQAVRALFERRSLVELLGKHIDTKTGEWTETASGPGSNSDSFYEYLWKMYATFNDREMLAMFDRVYPAVSACNAHGDWFADVSMWSGCAHGPSVVFENLVAFWPGMQASLGHLGAASNSVNAFYRVWREYGFVPEQFNVLTWKPVRGSGGGARYPLRPELIESTFYLHEATRDSSWLRAGAHFVHSLQKHTKTSCGYATVKDVETKELEDNMPSFFLSETCKYLYLLFNTTHFLRNGSYVFTTEAHPFPVLPARLVERVLLPTNHTTTTTSATTTTTTTTTTTRNAVPRQCPLLPFWHALGYQLDYEGVVVARTERCARPTSPKPLVTDVDSTPGNGLAAGHFRNLDDWLPLFEKQFGKSTATSQQSGEIEFMQRTLVADTGEQVVRLKGESVPTDELMARLAEKMKKYRSDQDDGQDVEGSSSSSRLVSGGPRLGLFRLDQTDALIRFTRQDTGEWIETTGIEDHRYTVLSWLPERRGFSGQPHAQDPLRGEDEDDELPLLLPLHRVYDFAQGRRQDALRRYCTLAVDISLDVAGHENPYTSMSASSPFSAPKSFAFSCVGSSFGVMPLDSGAMHFPAAPMVLTEPLDACVPLVNAAAATAATDDGALKHKIAIVKRGSCFFETKVRNAAAAGAVGVVVVNHEDDDRVMVMSGSIESVAAEEDGEGESESEEGKDDRQQSVTIPAIMVPRRAGEWLSRQLAKAQVSGRIELSLQDRAADVASIHAYLAAAEASEQAGDDDQQLRRRKHELAKQVYPRMETERAHLGRITMFAPEWAIDITPVNKPNSDELTSFLLEIVDAPQTQEQVSSASP